MLDDAGCGCAVALAGGQGGERVAEFVGFTDEVLEAGGDVTAEVDQACKEDSWRSKEARVSVVTPSRSLAHSRRGCWRWWVSRTFVPCRTRQVKTVSRSGQNAAIRNVLSEGTVWSGVRATAPHGSMPVLETNRREGTRCRLPKPR